MAICAKTKDRDLVTYSNGSAGTGPAFAPDSATGINVHKGVGVLCRLRAAAVFLFLHGIRTTHFGVQRIERPELTGECIGSLK